MICSAMKKEKKIPKYREVQKKGTSKLEPPKPDPFLNVDKWAVDTGIRELSEESVPHTPLSRKLLSLRTRAIDTNMKLLTEDEVLEEIRHRRGELDEQELLLKLVEEVKVVTKRAKASLERGIRDVEHVIKELRDECNYQAWETRGHAGSCKCRKNN